MIKLSEYGTLQTRSAKYSWILPPKPSCRRPLSRMSRNETAKVSSTEYSPSTQSSRHSDPQSDENNENSDTITDDDGDDNQRIEKKEEVKDSYQDNKFRSANYDDLRHRISSDRSGSTESNTKSPRRSEYYDYEDNLDESNEISETEQSSKYSNTNTKKHNTAIKFSLGKCLGLIMLIAIIGAGYFVNVHNNSQTLDTNDLSIELDSRKERITTFRNSMKNIRLRFPGQNIRSWNDIEAGIVEIIKESEKPSIIVLFSNRTNELSCLAKMLGKASSEALHSDGSLELHPKDFGEDYGLAIDHWKSKIIAKKAVVVHDLLNINPRAIQAFHTMCDRENPLVEGAVYILTIITVGIAPEFDEPIKFVEDQLTNRFINKIPVEKLQPLITRLMDGPIISVEPELTLTRCPL